MAITLITNKQKQIISFLGKFRYLTTYHFQKLLNHKDPHRIKEWLKDLKGKGYIAVIKNEDPTKPFIYCLGTKSKQILKAQGNSDENILSRLYKEKSKTEAFIEHHLSIASVCLFLLSQKEEQSQLNFFTKQDLSGYDYFPNPSPDAYIAIKTKKQTSRYFLDSFDPNVPPFVPRNRIKYYLKYSQEGQWGVNTDSSPFPSILFICPNERLKRHIYMYGQSILQKSFSGINLFLTTSETINQKRETIWERVE